MLAMPLAMLRRCLAALVLGVCAVVLVHTFAVEPLQVPTGSMAPALYGHHRLCTCPRCGCEFPVGRHPGDRDGAGQAGCYRKSFCPNCGQQPIPVSELRETTGDQVLVDKAVYVVRAPRRWEVVVLRLFGTLFIKRLIGLPGENVQIRDGDVYVDGRLARKTFEEAWAMRVPVFAGSHALVPSRWQPPSEGTVRLDGCNSPVMASYHNFLPDTGKAQPLDDEYAYNAGAHAGVENVHDFLFEATIEVQGGTGTLGLRLCDGQEWAEIELPVGSGPLRARSWPLDDPADVSSLAVGTSDVALQSGQAYQVKIAFVDRRLSLVVDGVNRLTTDLPEPGQRRGVVSPIELRADGVVADVRNCRLYRDVHYSQRGEHAVGGRSVHLGPEQYFVLGDNSAHSEDSRYWAHQGRVGAERLVGRVFLVHFPSRRLGDFEVPDPARVRWLR
jgi:signal peptidase I